MNSEACAGRVRGAGATARANVTPSRSNHARRGSLSRNPNADATPAPTADVGEASDVTPLDDTVVEAARQEGAVLLYTNAEDQQMAPIKKAFEADIAIARQADSADDIDIPSSAMTTLVSTLFFDHL